MQSITLHNGMLTATIHPLGAELQSLLYRGIDYMWSGGAAWPKHSPVLFPIVGTLKQNSYTYGKQAYQLPRHGFARNMEFSIAQQSSSEAIFTLHHSASTLAVYPFKFELALKYSLQNTTLTCQYTVKNPDADATLWFSLGAHPAFAVPLLPHQAYSDYYLQFSQPEKISRFKLDSEGLTTDLTELVEAPQGILPLKPELFFEDALVLKNLESTTITLGSKSGSQGLYFHFHDFPFLGIWAAKNAPFVCLEPWCGIADHQLHNQQLEQKEGINALAPGQSWQRQWQVEVF